MRIIIIIIIIIIIQKTLKICSELVWMAAELNYVNNFSCVSSLL